MRLARWFTPSGLAGVPAGGLLVGVTALTYVLHVVEAHDHAAGSKEVLQTAHRGQHRAGQGAEHGAAVSPRALVLVDTDVPEAGVGGLRGGHGQDDGELGGPRVWGHWARG